MHLCAVVQLGAKRLKNVPQAYEKPASLPIFVLPGANPAAIVDQVYFIEHIHNIKPGNPFVMLAMAKHLRDPKISREIRVLGAAIGNNSGGIGPHSDFDRNRSECGPIPPESTNHAAVRTVPRC